MDEEAQENETEAEEDCGVGDVDAEEARSGGLVTETGVHEVAVLNLSEGHQLNITAINLSS